MLTKNEAMMKVEAIKYWGRFILGISRHHVWSRKSQPCSSSCGHTSCPAAFLSTKIKEGKVIVFTA